MQKEKARSAAGMDSIVQPHTEPADRNLFYLAVASALLLR